MRGVDKLTHRSVSEPVECEETFSECFDSEAKKTIYYSLITIH